MDLVNDLAKMIDHSLLHPTMNDVDLKEGCELARQYRVASVCIKPYAVPIAVEILRETDVLVGTVAGFPHGSSTVDIKISEALQALENGAFEIDVVVNIGKVLQKDWDYIHNEIHSICSEVHRKKGILKVIFENDFLPSDEFKIQLCRISSAAGVDFVKTSTGYGMVKGKDGKYSYKGATHHDLQLMRKHCSSAVQVKAAGGVRTLDDLLAVKKLGVTRVGATATAVILEEARERFSRK